MSNLKECLSLLPPDTWLFDGKYYWMLHQVSALTDTGNYEIIVYEDGHGEIQDTEGCDRPLFTFNRPLTIFGLVE